MAKLVGPLFSLDAKGTFAKALSFGSSRLGSWLRRLVKKKYTRTLGQDTIRKLFKEALEKWQEVFYGSYSWFQDLTLDDNWLWEFINKGRGRGGRCEFIGEYIKHNGVKWPFYPLSLRIPRIVITDKIENYDGIISDLETLTGLELCHKPTVIALMLLNLGRQAGALGTGKLIFIRRSDIDPDGWYRDTETIAEELTHCLLIQHGYSFYSLKRRDHETIASECGARVAKGELTPIYKYQGKTLSEIVPVPSCS